jgi:cellobiose-specific phosphotransferase system component IIB
VGSYAGGSNASLLIKKAKVALRRSTLDSEALALSNDELDQRESRVDVGPGNRGIRLVEYP